MVALGQSQRLIGALLLAVFVGSCGEGGLGIPTVPSGPMLSGTWMGWLSSITTGIRTGRFTLFQTGPVLTGVYTLFEPNRLTFGTLSGTVIGSTAFLTLHPDDAAACTISMTSAITTPTRLEGTWRTEDCDIANSGTFQWTPE